MEKGKKIAIVGTGIAGMACAYHLRRRNSITVYEKNNYMGGHTNTIVVKEGARSLPVDTGFMVYNTRTYPNLVKFFEELGIRSKPTSMSFGINNTESGFEARFTSLQTFFAQNYSKFSFRRWRMLRGIQSFFKEANYYLNTDLISNMTLGEYIERTEPNKDVIEDLILPMAAAVWSTPHDRMLEVPAYSLFSFLKNHGMLGIGEQFEWLTLIDGSRQYRDIVQREIAPFTRLSNAAKSIQRLANDRVNVVDAQGESEEYDIVIVAAHADQALALLDKPTEIEERLLSKFKYNSNAAILHSDKTVMPKAKKAWASWNYRYDLIAGEKRGSTHYWMNNLQGVSDKRDYFVSIDYLGKIDDSKNHWSTTYEHPRFNSEAIAAQQELPTLNENGSIYFCGSYFKHGFHEDAYTSALNVCNRIANTQEVEVQV